MKDFTGFWTFTWRLPLVRTKNSMEVNACGFIVSLLVKTQCDTEVKTNSFVKIKQILCVKKFLMTAETFYQHCFLAFLLLLVISYTHQCFCLHSWKVSCHIFTFFSTAYSRGSLCFQALIREPMFLRLSFHTFFSLKSQHQDGFGDPAHYHKIMGYGSPS